MGQKLFLGFLSCIFLLFTNVIHAQVITVGALTTSNDGTTEIISDNLNNYEWLRFDVLADMNYEQTLTAMDNDGKYQGWQMAGITEAQKFIDALFSPNTASCTLDTGAYCGRTNFYDGLFGDNFNENSGIDFVFFLSENNTGKEVGIIQFTPAAIFKDDDWASLEESNYFSASGINPTLPISWLLFRDLNSAIEIPEPKIELLIILGLLAYFFTSIKSTRKKTKSV